MSLPGRVCRVGAIVVAVGLSLAFTTGDIAEAGGTRDAFLGKYRCELYAHLQEIRSRSLEKHPKDRFIGLGRSDNQHRYVQCIFVERDTQMLCEAASGHFAPDDEKEKVVPPGGLEKLERLGYSTEKWDGNHQKTLVIRTSSDVLAAAELILATLHDVFAARIDTELDLHAPLGRPHDAPEANCAPTG